MHQRQVSGVWCAKDELPIEIDLGPSCRYHSIFACPILRQQVKSCPVWALSSLCRFFWKRSRLYFFILAPCYDIYCTYYFTLSFVFCSILSSSYTLTPLWWGPHLYQVSSFLVLRLMLHCNWCYLVRESVPECCPSMISLTCVIVIVEYMTIS